MKVILDRKSKATLFICDQDAAAVKAPSLARRLSEKEEIFGLSLEDGEILENKYLKAREASKKPYGKFERVICSIRVCVPICNYHTARVIYSY